MQQCRGQEYICHTLNLDSSHCNGGEVLFFFKKMFLLDFLIVSGVKFPDSPDFATSLGQYWPWKN